MSATETSPESPYTLDLTLLENISDDIVVESLKHQYELKAPYIRINSSILVSVNPSQQLDIYADENAQKYVEACYRNTTGNAQNLPCHIYELAAKAYLHLRRTGQDQTVLLSGITGSGKTESYKLLLKQFCNLTNSKKDSRIHEQVQVAQNVLEAFGNAKTLQNPNASRYGMFQEVQYNERGRVIGTKTLTYLLEKSRVTSAAKDERSFNIFYYLLLGANSEEKTHLHLQEPTHFNYLSRTQCYRIPDVDDQARFNELKESMKTLGLKTKVQLQIFRLLSVILHLGNLEFVDQETQDSCSIKNQDLLEIIAEFLGISVSSLSDTLTFKSVMIGKDICTVFLDAKAAREQRDSLSRGLYSLLFTWLVEAINGRICQEKVANFIGVLDQFGFQHSKENHFEGFCINFANEKLEQFILKSIFDDSVGINAEMASEGISLPKINYGDNTKCIELLCGQGDPGADRSLMSLIDEHAHDEKRDEKESLGSVIQSSFRGHPFMLHVDARIEYSTGSFSEKNLDVLSADFVNLFRGNVASSNPFIKELFSSAAVATETHPRNKNTVISAQHPTKPMRQPSRRYKKSDDPRKPANKTPTKSTTVMAQLNSTLNELFTTIEETKIWHIVHINPSPDHLGFDVKSVRTQIESYSLTDITKRLGFYFTASYEFSEFLDRYQPIFEQLGLDENRSNVQKIEAVKAISGWSDIDVMVGNSSKVFLSENTWKRLEDSLRSVEKDQRAALKGGVSGDNESLMSGLNNRHGSEFLTAGNHPALHSRYYDDGASFVSEDPYEAHRNYHGAYGHYGDDDNSIMSSEYDSKNQISKYANNGIELTKVDHSETGIKPNEQVIEVKPVTRVRKCWLGTTWTLTWWIPTFMLSACGLKRPDIQIAWREKVALCLIIMFLWGIMMFFIIGLGLMLCPRVYYYNETDVGYHTGKGDLYVYMKGKVYDISDFSMQNHGKNIQNPTGARYDQMEAYGGQDVGNAFSIPLSTMCEGLVTDQRMELTTNGTVDLVPHVTGQKTPDRTSNLASPTWFYDVALPKMKMMEKGDIAFETKDIADAAKTGSRQWGIIDGKIYDLSLYFLTLDKNSISSAGVYQMFKNPELGPDLTKIWKEKVKLDAQTRALTMNCLNKAFYIGVVDTRKSVQCMVAYWIPVGFAAILCAVIVIKFLAALQLGSKRRPEDLDKFVICQVPCYTEGEDSLRKTIDSLAGLDYDDKRKLLFIIADGMIIGSGNDRPTPKIVCDILGVDPNYDPEPFSFQSIGEGNSQHNMGKVYSGLYEYEGHVVPYVVVAKVGKPSERSRPGNRGKRDSQIILMNFLNRVHFDAEMSPLDLEIYHHIKNVIGVNPAFYEYVLMVDADTEVLPDSMTRLIACMIHDARLIGLCGETQLANEGFSWATMIQVYEYYISHHLAKAFESLFGSVTCLPGCFCMYRIRTTKGSPLIIATQVIEEYSENNVDTLHKKNLLSLGEDRYLTTLMLKHFPQYKMKFTPDAVCLTVAPEKWEILLSQRRRWINSTVHNLFELLFLPDLCGFCCFSMRFVVFLDLFGTLIMPATVVYLFYLIIAAIFHISDLSKVALIMFGVVYGLQAVIFILKRQWQHIGWMIIYLLAMPLFSFAIPLYSFWHFDDFSWGNTRVVLGDKGEKKIVSNEEPFDPKSIPMKKWSQFEQEAWEAGSSISKDSYGSQIDAMSIHSGSHGYGAGSEYYPTSYSPYPHDAMSEPRSSYMTGAHNYGQQIISPYTVASPYVPPASRPTSEMDPYSPYMAQNASVIFPGDDELVAETKRILQNANLMRITKKQVREQLSSVFNIDLTPRKDYINGVIEMILQGQM
ncbi:hypothetical protein K493DRAFT_383515 [Basidiobolus meristosporus CBS 931.73]|uniref:chitin synthase n=1 Tax=Basidiobolus meristosporus CBS 931.73 TaxID=1314790 RepID=A0A1Y1YZC6_9FUNG|nr:hypothetical protein K493DRAFT_383515 [Basidiobolus meristosporus CBS 931.73]|eukprot:ORY03392.1 hypothetical protein K493DRAFT_383515 [Basidiobolus meristosporus CBS 931.73]